MTHKEDTRGRLHLCPLICACVHRSLDSSDACAERAFPGRAGPFPAAPAVPDPAEELPDPH